MLNMLERTLDNYALVQPDFTPPRFGMLAARDGGMLEVSGLSVPIGTQCRIAHGSGSLTAETIGFRNGRTLMMLLGDPVLLRRSATSSSNRLITVWAHWPLAACNTTLRVQKHSDIQCCCPGQQHPAQID